MNDDLIIQSLKRAIQKMKEEPPGALFAMLQRDGIIDAEGRVLKRAPEPPEEAAANGKRKKPARSRQRGRKRPSTS